MRTTPPSPQPPRRDIWVRLLLYPGHTLPTALAPILIAGGLAWRDGVFAPVPLLLAFVGSWLIHVAGVFADNHELLRRHGELPEHPELNRALADGTLTLAGLRLAIIACLVLAGIAGIEPVRLGGWPAFWLGVVGVAASLGYAAGPMPYTRLGLADPLFLLMFGVVAPAGAYGVQAAASAADFAWTSLPWQALVVGLPVGCLVTSVMVIDDIRDRRFDRDKRWRTVPARYGLAAGRWHFVALQAFAYASPLWLWWALDLSPWVLSCWLTAPLAVSITRHVLRYEATADLLRMSPRTSLQSMLYAALLGAGVALG